MATTIRVTHNKPIDKYDYVFVSGVNLNIMPPQQKRIIIKNLRRILSEIEKGTLKQ